ncbi:MAG: tail fiber assembly protein [Hafnia sp.]
MYLYSKSKNLFYLKENIDNYKITGVLPGDCIDVTDEVFNKYSGNSPPGKVRIAGEDGMPDWGDIPPPTHNELVDAAESEKKYRLAESDAATADWRTELALGIIDDDDKAKLTAWMKYIKAVKAIDTSTAPDVTWPDKPA